MQALSWHGYLMATQQLGEWVDRGCPRPTHGRWGEYITWAAETAGITVRRARIGAVERTGRSWLVDVGGTVTEADGLVFTGPGDALRLPGQPVEHPRVLDGRTVWQRLADLPGEDPDRVRGRRRETSRRRDSASRGARPVRPDRAGQQRGRAVHEGGELHREPHVRPDPAAWLRLPERRQRRAFIRRTDRGVFSVSVQSVLDQADRVHTVLGRVRRVRGDGDAVEVEIDDGQETSRVRYDLVVTAIGFDALWWLPLFTEAALAALARAVGSEGRVGMPDVERSIGFSLAVENLFPALHLPMLAGLAQGPGFPNLSCLGLLSDRILQSCLIREPSNWERGAVA